MKKLNGYLKLSIVMFGLALMSGVLTFVFVLLPIYQLAGRSDPDAGQKLDQIKTVSRILYVLVWISCVTFIVSLVIGILKLARKSER